MRSTAETASADRLRQDKQQLEQQLREADNLVGELVPAIVSQYRRQGWIDKQGEELIRHRLAVLEGVTAHTPEEQFQMFTMSLMVSDTSSIVRLADRSPNLLDGVAAPDLLTVAEAYMFTNDQTMVRQLLDKIRPQLSSLSHPQLLRYGGLMTLVGVRNSDDLRVLSEALSAPPLELQKTLAKSAAKLEEAAEAWRAHSASSR